ncbi:MAG: ABC transporter ATP-binding protein [Caldisphaera sp.]
MISIRNLNVRYKTPKGLVYAIDNINMDISEGIIFGLVGESGSGKTTLGLTILRILPRNAFIESGEIFFSDVNLLNLSENDMMKYRGKKISMIFQGAMNSLNPVINIEKQVAEPLIYHENIYLKEALKIAREKLRLVGLPENVGKMYPHQLSGGMKQRVIIAMALITEPELLIADEPTTALDVITQKNIILLIKSLQKDYNITTLLISHDLPLVSEISDYIGIMYGGKILEIGENNEIIKNYKHPYTAGLINSIPSIKNGKRLEGIPGDPISLLNPSNGCRFYNRCKFANEFCKNYDYTPYNISNSHKVYCTIYRGV